jgi:hypothetical protein
MMNLQRKAAVEMTSKAGELLPTAQCSLSINSMPGPRAVDYPPRQTKQAGRPTSDPALEIVTAPVMLWTLLLCERMTSRCYKFVGR